MIVSQVELKIEKQIQKDFRAWLPGHVERVLATRRFRSAQILEELEDPLLFQVRYEAASTDDLNRYLAGPVMELRQEGIDAFGKAFVATRRVFQPFTP